MNMFKRLFKELGYVSKNDLIEKAVTIYLNHSGAKMIGIKGIK